MRIRVRVEGLERRPFAQAAARVAERRLSARNGNAGNEAIARHKRDAGGGSGAGTAVADAGAFPSDQSLGGD